MTKVLVRLIPVIAAGLVAGCEAPPQPPTAHPVRGTVIYDGTPAAGVIVVLYPETGTIDPPPPAFPNGVTGPDGTFSISTYGKGDGAPEGGYQIVLKWPPEKKDENEEQRDEDRLFGWYDPPHSRLSYRVKPGDNTIPTLKLPAVKAPPAASEGVPGRN